MPTVSVSLDEVKYKKLDERAKEQGLSVDDLVRQSIDGLLTPKVQLNFEEAAQRVLNKNEELYRRLAQ